MTFASKLLADLEEKDLQGLIGQPEGTGLEFKRELNLDTVEQKREVAKDVSAMANAIGGRVVYGMAERTETDGSRVASRIMPLTDGRLAMQLTDTLFAYIEPRVLQIDVRAVPVSDGHVLVVEVPTPRGLDLHMVVKPDGGTFHRRGPIGNVPMSENEIRETYSRIVERRSSLSERVDALMRPELTRRGNCHGSFLIVPVHSRPNLVDPRRFPKLGEDLYHGVLSGFELRNWALDLAIMHDGFRSESRDSRFDVPSRYLAIQKTGVVHWSAALREPADDQLQLINTFQMGVSIVQTLILSRWLLREAGYFGDVFLKYIMVRPRRWTVTHDPFQENPVAPGAYESTVASFDLESGPESWGLAVKELLDPFFHAAGRVENPYFSRSGLVRKDCSNLFAPFREYLRVEGDL